MADRRVGGISLGGILVIVGIVLIIVWSFWIGLIVALIGLIAFGGFARGKWYLSGVIRRGALRGALSLFAGPPPLEAVQVRRTFFPGSVMEEHS